MATYKIKGGRLLRKYRAQYETLSYMALTEAEKISATLGDVPWEEVSPRDATFPAHSGASGESDAENVAMRDSFDAALFCAEHNGLRHRAYANAACYRFVLPDEAVGQTLASVRMRVFCDPYNANGARVSVYTSDDALPPMECSVCRTGSLDDVSPQAQSNNATENTPATEWYSSNTHVEGVAPRKAEGGSWYSNNGYAIITPEGGLTLKKYLFVFVMMENYAVARNGFLEGAAYVDSVFEISFSGEVSQLDADKVNDLSVAGVFSKEFNVCRDGVLPLLNSNRSDLMTYSVLRTGDPLMSAKLGAESDSLNEAFCTLNLGVQNVIQSLDGPITGVDVSQPACKMLNTTNGLRIVTAQYAVIVGRFSKGTFLGLPGLLIYDVVRGMFLENIEAAGLDPELVAAAKRGELRGGCVRVINLNFSTYTLGVYAALSSGMMAAANAGKGLFAGLTMLYDSGEVSSATAKKDAYVGTSNLHFFVQTRFTNIYPNYGWVDWVGLDVSDGVIKIANGGDNPSYFPADGIPYKGQILSIRSVPDEGDSIPRIVISGRLQEVGGKKCTNCAIITFGDNGHVVSIPGLDEKLTPDTYESFCVAGNVDTIASIVDSIPVFNKGVGYTISGAFESLGGNVELKKIVKVASNGGLEAVSGISGVSAALGATETLFGVFFGRSQRTSDFLSFVDVSGIDYNATNLQSCIGLRSLYAKFYLKSLLSVSSSTVGSKKRIGAGFVVRSDVVDVDVLEGDILNRVSLPIWSLTATTLVVPFSVPQDFRTLGIKLSCPSVTSTGGKINVWLKRGEYVSDMPAVSEASFYLADKDEVSGWELIGSIDPTEREATFRIAPLMDRVASLLFTAYISLDDLNPSDDMATPQGICTEISVDPVTGAITGLDSTWKPDITLLGS